MPSPPTALSVVIPSTGRETLTRTVDSILAQQGSPSVIVVFDLPCFDHGLRQEAIGIGQISVFFTGGGAGPSRARQIGLEAVTTPYVAFVDDDDYWLSNRVSAQLSTLGANRSDELLILCGARLTRPDGTVRRAPRRPLHRGESLASYACVRSSLQFGETLVQTSVAIVSTGAARETLWDASLSKYEDWDFLLRLSSRPSVLVRQSLDSLAVISQGSPGSLSKRSDPSSALTFLERFKEELSARAAADFFFVHVMPPLVFQSGARYTLRLLREFKAFRPHLAAIVRGIVECWKLWRLFAEMTD